MEDSLLDQKLSFLFEVWWRCCWWPVDGLITCYVSSPSPLWCSKITCNVTISVGYHGWKCNPFHFSRYERYPLVMPAWWRPHAKSKRSEKWIVFLMEFDLSQVLKDRVVEGYLGFFCGVEFELYHFQLIYIIIRFILLQTSPTWLSSFQKPDPDLKVLFPLPDTMMGRRFFIGTVANIWNVHYFVLCFLMMTYEVRL